MYFSNDMLAYSWLATTRIKIGFKVLQLTPATPSHPFMIQKMDSSNFYNHTRSRDVCALLLVQKPYLLRKAGSLKSNRKYLVQPVII